MNAFGDRLFSSITRASGLTIVLLLASVAIFLSVEAWPGITARIDGESFWTYAAPLAFGTVWSATIALLIGAPLAIAVALFVVFYAPPKFGAVMGYLIDLLAAIPSVVYGLWGLAFLAPNLTIIYSWLAENLSFIPIFAVTEAGGPFPISATGRTMFTAGIVLAIMILPVISAMSREVFLQTPALQKEAAIALGATRWEMIRLAVLPHSRSGMIGAVMLGLGRALGETMAVAMVLSATGVISFRLLSSTNPTTIPANIAYGIKESSGLTINILIATGLVLFIITLVVNFTARWIADRQVSRRA